jgi:two-component system, NtrC family, response regulator HydG
MRKRTPAARPATRAGLARLVGRSPAMARLLEQIRHLGSTTGPVLVTGEHGTGRGLVAEVLHEQGARSGPFVRVSGAGAADALGGELFGVAAAAGQPARPGAIEAAAGGTLFLDEVGALPPALQSGLLRLVRDRAFEPAGGGPTRIADVRVIASSTRDLAAEAAAGRFRPDLYERLAVVRLALPPLRERPEDIPLLAATLVRELDRAHGRRITGLTRGVLDRLGRHRWPGNVRELRDVLESMVAFADGRRPLDLDDLPRALREPRGAGEKIELAVGTTVAEAERQLIEATMRHTGGDKRRAAAMLGIGLRTLYRKLGRRPQPRATRGR